MYKLKTMTKIDQDQFAKLAETIFLATNSWILTGHDATINCPDQQYIINSEIKNNQNKTVGSRQRAINVTVDRSAIHVYNQHQL